MADSLVICERYMTVFIDLCKQTGVPLTPETIVGRASALQLVSITLDAVSMVVRLPEDKLTQCRYLLQPFLEKQKVTLRELQSLVGVLNFACSVVVPVRALLRRLIYLTLCVSRLHYHL